MQAKIHLAVVLVILIITGPDGQTVYAERHITQINLDPPLGHHARALYCQT